MRILVVEDDHTIAQAIREGLEQESYAVDVEFDGADGFAAANTSSYDLLILDVMLPGMSGIDIAKQLRAEKIHVRILMLTAKDKIQDRVRGLNTGADDYMIKPFSFEELLARVRALLRRPEEKLGEVLEAGDLTLDTIAKEVKRGGKLIPLSSKEFALLEYMLRNKGRVLSKSNLINHVWDFDSDVLPNTVEVFVNYLRAKVDKPFKSPELIHTVRGFGYKVDDDVAAARS